MNSANLLSSPYFTSDSAIYPRIQDGADGGGRTHTLSRVLDFESSASANSATSATFDCQAAFCASWLVKSLKCGETGLRTKLAWRPLSPGTYREVAGQRKRPIQPGYQYRDNQP